MLAWLKSGYRPCGHGWSLVIDHVGMAEVWLLQTSLVWLRTDHRLVCMAEVWSQTSITWLKYDHRPVWRGWSINTDQYDMAKVWSQTSMMWLKYVHRPIWCGWSLFIYQCRHMAWLKPDHRPMSTSGNQVLIWKYENLMILDLVFENPYWGQVGSRSCPQLQMLDGFLCSWLYDLVIFGAHIWLHAHW